jgi:hypothetical protein
MKEANNYWRRIFLYSFATTQQREEGRKRVENAWGKVLQGNWLLPVKLHQNFQTCGHISYFVKETFEYGWNGMRI